MREGARGRLRGREGPQVGGAHVPVEQDVVVAHEECRAESTGGG